MSMTPGGNTPEMDSAEKMRRTYMDEIYDLRAKLKAAKLVIKEMSGAQFGLYHNRLRDGSGKCGEPCGVCRAEAAEAEVARLRAAMETDLIYVTSRMDEHPEGYEGACWCRSCCSYATDDGEGKP